MPRKPVLEAVDKQLRAQGSTIETFLTVGLEAGKSPKTLTNELAVRTGIEVNWRTVYRWIDDFKVSA